LVDPVVRLAVAVVAACLLGSLLLRASSDKEGAEDEPASERSPQSRLPRTLTNLRHTLAVIATGALLWWLPRLDTTPEAMLLAAVYALAVLLMTPEIVAPILRRLPTGAASMRLARRQLLRDSGRSGIAVATLAAVLGLPLGYLALLDTMIRTAEAGVISGVAPQQISLEPRGGKFLPPPRAVVDTVEGRIGLTDPVRLRYLWSKNTFVLIGGTGNGAVLALDSPEDVARFGDLQLSTEQQTLLTEGGMLTWDDQEGDRRTLSLPDGATQRSVAELPVAAAEFAQAWQQGTSGVLLTSTARRLDLPVSSGAFVYTGVSDDEAAAARRAVLDAGLDPKQVVIYESPDGIYVPEALYASAVGLMLIVLGTSVVVARTQVATLRSYLGGLIAIGLPVGWVRQVIVLQNTAIVAMSTVLALVLAIPPVVITAALIPDFVLSLPWRWIGLVIVAFFVAVLGATMISSRRLRAADRFAT
ncbi:MAG: hypothetical protein H0U28_12240, partial [Nocardioidaceae bacterium]|nr:hypothetical protein [Nocardioidaceae bacterium]